MNEIELVERLSKLYGFDVEEALILIEIKDERDKNKREIKKNIRGFDGIVNMDCCKAVVYNHGLYTQCENKCNGEFCSSTCKQLKYGHINIRKNYGLGKYVLENGRREINIEKVKKRLEKNTRCITIDSDSDSDSDENKLRKATRRRGRPKEERKNIKIEIDSVERIEELEVRVEEIEGEEYLVSEMGEVFSRRTLNYIGRRVMGRLERIK